LWVPCAVKGALVGAERRCGGARSVADFKAENLTLASYTEVVSIRIRGSRNQRHTRRLLAPAAARAHGHTSATGARVVELPSCSTLI
jgi:hypothetical protein